jgi:molecular chaperone DnaK (HSP70)
VAGKIAGLKVERIINEPTAAAVAFGLRSKKNLNVLVFDLGGGTFDVSLMTIDSGVYDVIATSGDMHLGGEDFDHKILDQLILEFEKKHGTNLGANPRAIQKLKRATEEAKKSLSAEKHTEEKIYIDSLHRGIDFEFKLTRARLEHVNEEAFKRTLLPVEAVLKRSGMRKDEIDNILLVGGSTRIPKVKKLLADFFGGRQLTQEVQPDFVVSQGAAIVGAVIAKKIKHEIQLTDVLSQALGTEVVTGEMVTILETNAKIPTSGSKPFTTIQDNQKSVIVRVFQGEHKIAKNNQFLGEFVLSSIPPMKKGVPSIETTFTVDREGILHVTAVESTTGAKNSITIKDSLMLSPDEVSDAEIRHRDLVVRNQAIHNFNAELNKVDDKIQTVSATIKVTLENIRKTYENWFKEHPQATHKELDVKRESLLAEFKANMKAYGHDEL